MWEQIRERERLFDGAFAWAGARFNLARSGQTVVDGLWVSGRMFDLLGILPVLGRTITEADDRRGRSAKILAPRRMRQYSPHVLTTPMLRTRLRL